MRGQLIGCSTEDHCAVESRATRLDDPHLSVTQQHLWYSLPNEPHDVFQQRCDFSYFVSFQVVACGLSDWGHSGDGADRFSGSGSVWITGGLGGSAKAGPNAFITPSAICGGVECTYWILPSSIQGWTCVNNLENVMCDPIDGNNILSVSLTRWIWTLVSSTLLQTTTRPWAAPTWPSFTTVTWDTILTTPALGFPSMVAFLRTKAWASTSAKLEPTSTSSYPSRTFMGLGSSTGKTGDRSGFAIGARRTSTGTNPRSL